MDPCVSLYMDDNKAEFQSFYSTLYTSQGFRPMEELLDRVPVRVSEQMNDALDKIYNAEEVKTAQFQMASSKAPGVDCFTTGFFQRHWNFLQNDIVLDVLDFLNGGELPPGINDMSITLIPMVRQFPFARFSTRLRQNV